MRQTVVIALALAASGLFPGASAADDRCPAETAGTRRVMVRVSQKKGKNESSILETAASAGQFRTLINALVATDLIKALDGDGPYTVFTPTDEAFEKLPKGTVAALLKPENRAALAAVLKNHVVTARVKAESVEDRASVTTINQTRLTLVRSGHDLKVENANVVKADIACGNGIIHVVDEVLMPRKMDLVSVAEKEGRFSTLVAALAAADLAETVKSSEKPLTILAPTDEAFAKLPADTLKSLLKPENKHKLAEILKYHVIPGRVTARQAISAGEAKTLQGGKVAFEINDGRLTVNEVKVIATDLKSDNGIIHAIDSVLLPK